MRAFPRIAQGSAAAQSGAVHPSLHILFLPPPPVPAFLLVDPRSDMERTTLNLDPLCFAVSEKCHSILVHEGHVPQIEHQRLPRRLNDEQLLDLLDVLRLHTAAESEHHLTVCFSLNPEHKSSYACAEVAVHISSTGTW